MSDDEIVEAVIAGALEHKPTARSSLNLPRLLSAEPLDGAPAM